MAVSEEDFLDDGEDAWEPTLKPLDEGLFDDPESTEDDDDFEGDILGDPDHVELPDPDFDDED